MKAPVMSKLMTLMASILIVFILAVFQEAVAAATTGGADVITTHPLSKTSNKRVTTPKTRKRALNLHQTLAGTTLITYTYDNNGNLINKTESAAP